MVWFGNDCELMTDKNPKPHPPVFSEMTPGSYSPGKIRRPQVPDWVCASYNEDEKPGSQ